MPMPQPSPAMKKGPRLRDIANRLQFYDSLALTSVAHARHRPVSLEPLPGRHLARLPVGGPMEVVGGTGAGARLLARREWLQRPDELRQPRFLHCAGAETVE